MSIICTFRIIYDYSKSKMIIFAPENIAFWIQIQMQIQMQIWMQKY